MRTKKLAVFTILACLLPAALPAQQREIKEAEVHGHTMYTLLAPGDIPAVFEPKYVPISIADEYYYPDEPLIAVIDGGEAKAFSTWHLDHHEVVNDYINGKAITVTW